MTILRAASFGMPAYTGITTQSAYIAARSWPTSHLN